MSCVRNELAGRLHVDSAAAKQRNMCAVWARATPLYVGSDWSSLRMASFGLENQF